MFESFIGVNFWTALVVLINTLLIYFVGKRYLFEPVKNMIDSRKQEIDAMYAKADQAIADAEASRQEYAKALEGAKEEAAAIVRTASRTAQDRGEQIILEAKEEAAAIRAKASDDIARERKNAVNEIKSDISEIAVTIASKVAQKEISEKDHEKLIEEFIDQMGEAV